MIKRWDYLLLVPLVFALTLFVGFQLDFERSTIATIFESDTYSFFNIFYGIVLLIINLITIQWYKNSVLDLESSFEKHHYKWVMFILYATVFFSFFPNIWELLIRLTNLTVKSQAFQIILFFVTITYLLSILI